jgi:CcdB protein
VTTQFDIVENRHSQSKRHFPYLLVLQHDFLDDIKSVVVAPIRIAKGWTGATKLAVPIEVAGEAHLVIMYSLAALDRSVIGSTVTNAIDHRDAIVRAYDIIISGI